MIKTLYFFRSVKLRCDSRFQRKFTACSCVFKVITSVGSNQRGSKRTLKMRVATQLFKVINLQKGFLKSQKRVSISRINLEASRILGENVGVRGAGVVVVGCLLGEGRVKIIRML